MSQSSPEPQARRPSSSPGHAPIGDGRPAGRGAGPGPEPGAGVADGSGATRHEPNGDGPSWAEALLEAEGPVLRMIAAGRPRGEVLGALCLMAEALCPGVIGSVSLLEPDGRGLRRGADPSLPRAYRDAIEAVPVGPGRGCGASGAAAHAGEPVLSADIAADPAWADLAHLALAHGLRACLSTPFRSATGAVLGTFDIYFREPHTPTSREERVARRAAELAAIAVERQRAEPAPRASEEHFRAVYDQAAVGIAEVDLTGRFTRANDRYCEIVGYPREELLALRFQDITHPDDLPSNLALFDRIAERTAPYAIEKRYVRRDGRVVWARAAVSLVRDGAGRPAGVVAVIEDITERVWLEAELRRRVEDLGDADRRKGEMLASLRESEERFRGLMEQAPFSIQVFAPDGRHLRANRAWAHLWSVAADYVPEYNILEDPQLEAKGVLPYIRRAFAGEAVAIPAIEYDPNETVPGRTNRADPRRWVSAVAYPLKDDAGRVREVVLVHEDITERRRAEEKLRESEAALRAFYDNSPVLAGVVEETGDGDILHLYDNPPTCRYFGVEPGATAGRRASELRVGPEAIALWLGSYRESERRGGPVRFEFEYDAPGKHRWLSVTVCAIGASPSGRSRYCYVAEDVTERRRLSEQLEVERSLLGAFFASTTVGLGLVDTRCRFLRVNEALAETNGVPADAHIGRTIQEILPKLWPVLEPLIRRVLEAGEPLRNVEVEGETRKSPGGRSWIANYYPVRLGERIVGVGFAVVETTEARRAGEAVRASEARLRLALEAGRMGTWDWDIRTGALTWSDNLEGIHGLPPGGFDGTVEGFRRLVHPEDRERVEAAIARAIEGLCDYEAEFRILRPDGSVGWMLGKGKVFADESGRAARMIGVGMDNTGRKAAEEALREADRRKNEFLATLAHELRNPLAPIRSAARLLAGSPAVVAEAKAEVEMIERQADRLARLVDDLMDVARIERGKIEIRRQVIELAPVVRHAVEAVRPMAEGRGHELIVSPPPADPIRLEADPTRLEQVLDNLLTNAIKYTEPGGRIVLSAGRDGGEAVIRVADTGIGIPPEGLRHVFEMFAQVHGRSARSQGGLGIGLGLVRSLVEMHGGSIAVHSDGPGRGSAFVVRLPALPASPSPPERAEPGPGAGRRGGGGAPPRRRRILVVDDNLDAANSLAKVLRRLYEQEVRVAHGGPEALAAADAFRPEVVLLDLGMPGMDGYEVARHLRSRPEFAGTLLVALTGWGQEQDRRRSQQAGFAHHLVKPVDPETIRELLGGAGD